MIPALSGLGGMASFQGKFSTGLQKRGIAVTFNLDDPNLSAVLVIGGTRHFEILSRVRRRGVPIVQRLDGMNWLYKRRWTGVKKYCRSVINNWILASIRRYYADRIVYQSHFSQWWWESTFGRINQPSQVTWNAVDLDIYTPQGGHHRPEMPYTIQIVEGRFDAGNITDLENGVLLVEDIRRRYHLPVQLSVAAGIPHELQAPWKARLGDGIVFNGAVSRDRIPELDRSAHLFFSAEVNAACPNSVIEALACGLPVAAFDTGSLSELVTGDAGRIVPFGSDHWKLQPPVIPPLADAAVEILQDQPHFRSEARRRAEEAFNIESMIDGYLDALTF
jgi:glycosyltransferase involved in cell wall biosynthesis